eukprot:gnl/Dysnectes_brevis/859_a952_2710.p1 GENE.gnl/Dysnectes_brevis/859_a952_2710~~gnl/Dysnectes_brevis/859_a952_2710.p1  ORF type:complete len:150 (-),score=9.41 gnl/Dysnectes_brevis/859_a952_2710:72-521(-)
MSEHKNEHTPQQAPTAEPRACPVDLSNPEIAMAFGYGFSMGMKAARGMHMGMHRMGHMHHPGPMHGFHGHGPFGPGFGGHGHGCGRGGHGRGRGMGKHCMPGMHMPHHPMHAFHGHGHGPCMDRHGPRAAMGMCPHQQQEQVETEHSDE